MSDATGSPKQDEQAAQSVNRGQQAKWTRARKADAPNHKKKSAFL